MIVHARGVDPGLVHTGCVSANFYTERRELHLSHRAVLGTKVTEVRDWCCDVAQPHIWIEGYRPRSHFDTDERLGEFITLLKKEMPRARVLNNTGVKKVVTRELLELLELWKFQTTTHHQDLRSAARIMVLGMLKVDEMNHMLADFVKDHIEMRPWAVYHN